MGKMLENWRYASRLSRAVFAAITLFGALMWTLWQWPAPMISRTTQTGQVISVATGGVMLVKMDNGKLVHVMTPNSYPKTGDRLPMIVETYEDGTTRAYIDHDAEFMY
jgi:hypothetical protein